MTALSSATEPISQPTTQGFSARSAAVLTGLFGVLVSVTGSWIPSLWGDEAASVMSASRSLSSLLTEVAHVDAVHGVYYAMLHIWVDIFGASPFSVRIPSALAIGVCVAGVTWLCAQFGTVRFAVSAGAIAAILPRLTFAGEEARSYAFTAALATLLWIAVWQLARGAGRRWLIGYAAILAASMWLFVYSALIIPAVAIVVFLTPALRKRLGEFFLATSAAVIVALPLAYVTYTQRGQVAFLHARGRVNPTGIFVDMWFQDLRVAIVGWALILFTVAMYFARTRKRASHGIRLEVLAMAWAFVPAGILIAAEPFGLAYSPRYATFLAPAVAILIALALRHLVVLGERHRIGLVAAAAACVVIGATFVPTVVSQRTPYAKNHSDWNDISTVISTQAVEGDAIVFDESVRPSRRPRLAMNTDPEAFVRVSDPTLVTAYADGTSWHDEATSVADAANNFAGVERVWLVEYAIDGKANTWGQQDLERLGYRLTSVQHLERSDILLYER